MGGRLAQKVRAGRVGFVTGLFHGVLEEVASGDGALVGVCSGLSRRTLRWICGEGAIQ